jgi:hypothetical protein
MPAIFRLAGDTLSTAGPVDTSTNAPSILAINGFFCGFTVIVVLARIYVRAIMLKTFGTDDYLMLAATVRHFFLPSGLFLLSTVFYQLQGLCHFIMGKIHLVLSITLATGRLKSSEPLQTLPIIWKSG